MMKSVFDEEECFIHGMFSWTGKSGSGSNGSMSKLTCRILTRTHGMKTRMQGAMFLGRALRDAYVKQSTIKYGIFHIVLWMPAAALFGTSNGIRDCVFTRSEICFYFAGA